MIIYLELLIKLSYDLDLVFLGHCYLEVIEIMLFQGCMDGQKERQTDRQADREENILKNVTEMLNNNFFAHVN